MSIILLTKNAGDRFDELLARIDEQVYSGEVETNVIDSGSEDATVAIARDYGANVTEIAEEDFHHSRTRNLGATLASHDLLVFLTQDALPLGEDWLENLVTPLGKESVGAVYGRQIAYPDAKPMDKFFYAYFYPDERTVLTRDDTANERRFFLANTFVSDVCSAIDRKVWDESPFRDDVPMSEDKDFALRALRNDHTIIYEPSARVRHSHDYDLLSLFRRRFRDGRAYTQITDGESEPFVAEGFAYVFEELRFLWSNGHLLWLPYALLYDATHFIGFQTGKLVGHRL